MEDMLTGIRTDHLYPIVRTHDLLQLVFVMVGRLCLLRELTVVVIIVVVLTATSTSTTFRIHPTYQPLQLRWGGLQVTQTDSAFFCIGEFPDFVRTEMLIAHEIAHAVMLPMRRGGGGGGSGGRMTTTGCRCRCGGSRDGGSDHGGGRRRGCGCGGIVVDGDDGCG